MVFGFFIDVPLLTISFAIIAVFRMKLAGALTANRLPHFLLFLLAAVPLIIFEEQIDCMPAWCGKVAVPPTLYFLELEVLVLGLLAVFLRARSAPRVALAFSVYGIFFELIVGGLRGLQPSLAALFLVPYVGIGYAFVSLLPLEVLLGRRAAVGGVMAPPDVARPAEGTSAIFARIKVATKLAVKVVGD